MHYAIAVFGFVFTDCLDGIRLIIRGEGSSFKRPGIEFNAAKISIS